MVTVEVAVVTGVSVCVKKEAPPDSGAADTSIFTPCEGIWESIRIDTVKLSCAAAGDTVPFAGVVVITRFCSAGGSGFPPPPPFPQEEDMIPDTAIAKNAIDNIFFISVFLAAE